jgi:autophagy-related protein 9
MQLHAAALTTLNAVPNEFLPTPTPRELCAAVATFTGYYPRSWHKKEHTDAVRKRFFCLFDSKWLIYVREILGIVYTPYLLWNVLPGKAQQFLDFFVERTERQQKVGHVCAREGTRQINVSEIV